MSTSCVVIHESNAAVNLFSITIIVEKVINVLNLTYCYHSVNL